MLNPIIGRENELHVLEQFLDSNTAEFLAIYGRRRIGKTFLIRSFFENKEEVFFDVTGSKNGTLKEQIRHFYKQISEVFYRGAPLQVGKNWDETFDLLTGAIKSLESQKKIILFFDEFPWMATKNSRLVQNLDYYWNQHWSKDNRVKLIICGSSASWIIEKIVNNKGGLHNRITRHISLEPFNLGQTEEYLKSLSVHLNHHQIAQLYMTMGGVPYYLNKLEKGLSAIQSIEKLAFQEKSFLLEEFNNLFASLFSDSNIFVGIIRAIAAYRYGVGQDELLKKMGKALQGKGGVEKLKALQDTNFIESFKSHFHKKRGLYYKVIDEYSLFYLFWIEPIKDTLLKRSLVIGYWDKISKKPAYHNWAGLAFEAICYKHLSQIRKALSLSPTAIPSTWRYIPRKGDEQQGAQIDLLFDRDDDSITLCEIKYSDSPFVLTKEYSLKLKQKIDTFKRVTRTNKQIFMVLILSNGIKENQYSKEWISHVVTLDDLFVKI